jgi:membrane protein YqaA with SNARE-associated domain
MQLNQNPSKLKQVLGKWQYHVGIWSILLTVGLAVAIVFYWEDIRETAQYGYLGAFIISVFGGATILAPIPMTPVIFALGAVLKPSFAPYLGPVFLGMVAGAGETIGGVSIYMTGLGGGTAIGAFSHNRFQGSRLHKAYQWMMRWVEKRGSLTLFILSAVINPLFYPAALAAGAMRFGLRRYILICWGGKTIKGITVAAVGYWGLGGLLRLFGIPI